MKDLAALIAQIAFSHIFRGSTDDLLDIYDGNFDYDLTKILTPDQAAQFAQMNVEHFAVADSASNVDFVTRMLRKETSLSLGNFTILPRSTSTRYTIDDTIMSIVGKNGKHKSVALPVPNWQFWENDPVKEGKFSYNYLAASTADELVSGFAKQAKKVGAILLVNPQNPWGYKLEAEHCKAIDAIAQKNGVTVIIDEVLRGNQPIGSRESLGIHFSEPYVVEGFSHRFGYSMGDFSYVLVPASKKTSLKPTPTQMPTALLDMVYANATVPCLREIEKRNSSFTEGFYGLDIPLVQTAKTQITSLAFLPKKVDIEKVQREAFEEGLLIGPIKVLMPQFRAAPEKYANSIRLSVGCVSVMQAFDAGDKLSGIIRKYL